MQNRRDRKVKWWTTMAMDDVMVLETGCKTESRCCSALIFKSRAVAAEKEFCFRKVD